MRIAAMRISVHTHPARPPEGFIQLGEWDTDGKMPMGVIPDSKGLCQWVAVSLSRGFERAPVIAPLHEKDAKSAQNRWLMCPKGKKGQYAAAIGVSKRTWEGWEQGRPMPFFRASLLAILWEQEAKEDTVRARQSYRD